MTRSSKSLCASSAVTCQLQTTLTRSLTDCVAATVSSVCASFQNTVDKAQTSGRNPIDESRDYDQYYDHCRRLVDYIEQNMETSTEFAVHMDRIILACHSDASERVLNALVTEPLWFHRRGDALSLSVEREEQKQPQRQKDGAGSYNSSSRGSTSSARLTKEKKKKENSSRSSAQSLAKVTTKLSTGSSSMHGRSGASSKKATRVSEDDSRPFKRLRRAPRSMVHDRSADKEIKLEHRRKERKGVQELEDVVLSFEDAIGDLCYPDRRTSTQTKFFKDRLRKSIQFVDALLCNPPRGKVCKRRCKKIRAQMCSSSTPCKNEMCRIWHDVEAHTDCCLNARCEFKTRVLLRETMHKMEVIKQRRVAIQTKLCDKHAELKEVVGDDKESVEIDIASLEQDLGGCDGETGVLEAARRTFWRNLNEIGIDARDDVVDNFPDFGTHYGDKKDLRKARKVASTTARPSSGSSRNSGVATPHAYAGPHGSDDKDLEEVGNDNSESVGGNMHRSTPHRNTSIGRAALHKSSKTMKGMVTSGVKALSDRCEELLYRSPGNPSQHDEPPLPPAGPPPFRQNPELDREYAASVSGYSIQLPVDDREAVTVTANVELTEVIEPLSPITESEVQMLDTQRGGGNSFGMMTSVNSSMLLEEPLDAVDISHLHPSLSEPLAATGIRVKSPPVEQPTTVGMECTSPPAEFSTAGFTALDNGPQDVRMSTPSKAMHPSRQYMPYVEAHEDFDENAVV
uniref:Uncharacterized protein n=1 Tax=Hyaloperonospora arabidopsidis (strain Emoy2) TaxID=559515 RepID=M4C5B6_HYAAE